MFQKITPLLILGLVLAFFCGCGGGSTGHLVEAIENGDAGRVSRLLNDGASPNAEYDGFHMVPLAAMWGHHDIVRMLLHAGGDVDGRTDRGNTALMLTKDEAIAHLLLEHGAEVNARNNDGKTPLMFVTRTPLGIVLLDAGADVDAVDRAGKSVKDYVSERPMARELLKRIEEENG